MFAANEIRIVLFLMFETATVSLEVLAVLQLGSLVLLCSRSELFMLAKEECSILVPIAKHRFVCDLDWKL